jgi:heme/copper-type cytochrome/quinol oxidase subunit 1
MLNMLSTGSSGIHCNVLYRLSETGPASGGWTIYPPLVRLARPGVQDYMDLWLIHGPLYRIVSSGGLN